MMPMRGPRARREPGAASGQSDADDDSVRRAEIYALDLLARRPRTVREMAQKLEARGHSETVVADLLARMERVGYLDDRRFTRYWVEERARARPCGPARLRRELFLRGVPAEVVSSVLAEEMTAEVEETLAVRAAMKKAGSGRLEPGAATRRLWGFLRRRGFGIGACRAALAAVSGSPCGDDEWPSDPGDALP
jgi:regulatory protein